MLKNYKELKVWQKSYGLCLEIFGLHSEIGPDRIHLNTEYKDTSVYYTAINSKDKCNACV